jgi:nucleotide-binding universal stress UspA family protein
MTGTVKLLGKILLYIDGSESSMTAAKLAIVLAKRHGSQLRVIYVVNDSLLMELLGSKVFVQMEKLGYERDLEDDGKRYLNYVAKLAERKGVTVETILRKGIVHDVVSQEVDSSGCDVLVHGELEQVLSLHDSVRCEAGNLVLRNVACSVLVVRNKHRVDLLYDSI